MRVVPLLGLAPSRAAGSGPRAPADSARIGRGSCLRAGRDAARSAPRSAVPCLEVPPRSAAPAHDVERGLCMALLLRCPPRSAAPQIAKGRARLIATNLRRPRERGRKDARFARAPISKRCTAWALGERFAVSRSACQGGGGRLLHPDTLPSSSGPGRRPLTAKTGVRVP